MTRVFGAEMSQPQPFTYGDYQQLADDGKRWEVLDGALCSTPSPTTTHQPVSSRLHFHLMAALQQPGLAEVFAAPTDLLLSDTTVAVPDLMVIDRRRQHIITPRAVEGPPDVVVEILSPSTARRDWALKGGLYARYGIPEYWVVHPTEQTIVVHRIDEGAYRVAAELGVGDTLTSAAFPPLSIPLRAVFSR